MMWKSYINLCYVVSIGSIGEKEALRDQNYMLLW